MGFVNIFKNALIWLVSATPLVSVIGNQLVSVKFFSVGRLVDIEDPVIANWVSTYKMVWKAKAANNFITAFTSGWDW
mgnify:CR=1 FL=1